MHKHSHASFVRTLEPILAPDKNINWTLFEKFVVFLNTPIFQSHNAILSIIDVTRHTFYETTKTAYTQSAQKLYPAKTNKTLPKSNIS